ncbi:hypothetical protein PHET_11917, partial [Paragonimus heterotremus]
MLQLIGEGTRDIPFKDAHFAGACYHTDPHSIWPDLDWIVKLGNLNVSLASVCDTLELTSFGNTTLVPIRLGCRTKGKARLQLTPNIRPFFRPKRPVLYAALVIVEKELERFEQSGVIEPLGYSSLTAPTAVVRKAKDKVHICADCSTGLNTALHSHQYPLLIPENLSNLPNGSTCLAKVDLTDAYQVKVKADPRELLTISTHHGLFRFNRFPFV